MKTKRNEAPPERALYLLFSVFLISASAISYEILLMRLFSIIHWHHFAYMIISLALLGYGMSGTFLALCASKLRTHFAFAYLSNAALMGFLMLLCFIEAQRIPFNALEVVWHPRQALYLFLLYLLLALPFFCAANCIGLAFMHFKTRIHRVYLSDLFGGGFGALLIMLLLFALPPEDGLKILGALSLLGAAVAALDRNLVPSRLPAPELLLMGMGFFFVWPDAWFAIRMSEFKALPQTLQVGGTKVVAESSSPLGLLSVVESPKIPFRHAPGLSLTSPFGPPEQLAIFTDGGGMSVIPHDDGNVSGPSYLTHLTAALPYRLLKTPKVLVLGAGGGTDVLLARHHGAEKIDAVELNAQVVGLVMDTFSDFSGGLYEQPDLRLHIADARAFVAGSAAHFDLIQLSLLDAQAAASAGVHALSEGYL